jgi:preprotein translocase subunit YajC
MFKISLRILVLASFFLLSVRADEDVVTAVHGTVTKVDAAGKTIAVKTKDGTEHTFHFVDKTTVHGVDAAVVGAKDTFHGIGEGSEVVAHYTAKGAEETAVEVDKVGKGGMHVVEGTVTHVSEDGKTVVVKAADGTEHSFRVVGRDTVISAKDIGKGTEKGAKVTVYYTGSASKKVAHFFEKL